MAEQLSIRYKKDGAALTVVLSGESAEFFRRAALQPDLQDKDGEDLVAALLAQAQGAISWVERYKNGQLNDGPNGEAAQQMFSKSGNIEFKGYFANGRNNDAANGEPAVQIFDDRSWLTRAEHYKNGEKTKTWSEQEIKDYNYQLPRKTPAGRRRTAINPARPPATRSPAENRPYFSVISA
ncbi:MAG: hypothetical protein K8R48_01250 [Alphaproteobacteria bacterium]|nr:hypothetical protein [Alphaproteobacteria bacterium]